MLYIDVPRGFATHTTEIPDAIMSKVVSSNGKIGWIGGNGRPDLAAGHSIIAGEYKDKSPNLVTSCNQCVKQAKENPIELIVWPIAVADLRLVSFCDSSFDFKGIRHQQGWITGFTNQFLNKNQKAPVSIALWTQVAKESRFTTTRRDLCCVVCDGSYQLGEMYLVLCTL